MICPKCQTKNEQDARFCEQCGTALTQVSPVQAPPDSKKKPLRPLVIVLGCVAACCAVALAIAVPMLFRQPPATDGGNDDPVSTTTQAVQSVLTTAPTTAPTAPPKAEADNTVELYEEVLRAYAEAYPWDFFVTLPDIGEAGYLYHHHADMDEVGYVYLDVDHDGQRELLLGATSGSPPMIYDMYTIADGKLCHVLSSGERSFYRLRDDGKLVYTWHAGAAVHGTDLCRIKEDKSGVEGECRVAMDAFYAEEHGFISSMGDPTVEDNSWFVAENGTEESLYRQVTKAEALARQEEICDGLIEIDYQPLTSLPSNEQPTFSVLSFRGLTLDQATAIAGSGAQVSEYLFEGGWGELYYPNGEAPYSFFYLCDYTKMGKPVIGTELVTGVGVTANADVLLGEGMTSAMTLSALQKAFPNGEVYENMMDGGMVFRYAFADGSCVQFFWYDGNTAETADWVLMTF